MGDSLDYTIELEDGKKEEYFVRQPTVHEKLEADEIRSSAFTNALKASPPKLFKKAMIKKIMDQGLWSEEQQAKLEELQDRLREIEKITMVVGGIPFEDAVKLWIEARIVRNQQRDLLAIINEYDSETVEGVADSARFNFLAACCIMSKRTGKRHFQDVNDFFKDDKDPVAILGAMNFAQLYYNYGVETEESYFENKALKKYGRVDEDLRLVNEDGHLIDGNGRLINEDGLWVNKDGKRVDANNNLVDDEGNMITQEFKPFLDKRGKPIVEKKPKVEKVLEPEVSGK
jgi:hypothetical protein